MKQSFAWMLLLVSSALASVTLHAQKITTDYDHKVDFGQFHTFSFSNVQASDPLVQSRLKEDLTQALTAKGWREVPSGGDVSVAAIGARHNQQEYSTFYDGLGGGFGWRRGWGGGGFGESYTSTSQIPVGTLVVDLYDTKTKNLVWRGIASDTLSGNPEKNSEKLSKAVNKLASKLPPK